MKGYIRIGGAVFCGVAIIAIAFYARSYGASEKNGAVVVLEAPQKEYIESIDADQNGTPDWEDELNKNIIESVNASTTLFDTNEPYTPPTTLTGKFSEAFLKDYLFRKGSGETFEDPTEFVDSAVKSIDENTKSKRYSRLEIITTPTNDVSVREYGNRIAEIVTAPTSVGENESIILVKALEAGNPGMLDALDPKIQDYETFIQKTLLVPVPESLVQKHLDLLNAYAAILSDIRAMKQAFDDPLLTLSRLKSYHDDATTLGEAFKGIASVLTNAGMMYASDEPGSFFYRFAI